MKKGFYFQLGRKEIFVETSAQRKTQALASKIFKALIPHGYSIPDNPSTRKELHYYMQPATLEIKHCPAVPDMDMKAHDYYNISGKNFSGMGSNDINDGKTIVIHV